MMLPWQLVTSARTEWKSIQCTHTHTLASIPRRAYAQEATRIKQHIHHIN